MDRMPCGVTADLRRHEREQAEGEEIREQAEVYARREALDDVNESEVVREMVYDYEQDPSACLARCFANLDQACRGEKIGMDAITTALHNLRRSMIETRAGAIYEECVDAVNEPPCRCRGDCVC